MTEYISPNKSAAYPGYSPRYSFPGFLVILKKIRKKHQHLLIQERHINRHL
jgi:hypothetical protein